MDRRWYESKTLEVMHDERKSEIIEYFVSLIVEVADVVVPILSENTEHEGRA